MTCIERILVGTSDLEASLALYRDQLGLEVLRPLERVAAEECARWGVQAEHDVQDIVLAGAGQTAGLLRLVSFGAQSGQPVRAGARPYDSSPKNLDFRVRDIQAAYGQLEQAGHVFRSEPKSFQHHGETVWEAQLTGPDFVNVVLVQHDAGPVVRYTARGFAGVTQWVITVPDMARAQRRFLGLGMPLTGENRLAGPEIEAMIGLPPGAWLEIAMFGEGPYGGVEVVHYGGVEARDLTPLARPPNTGLLNVLRLGDGQDDHDDQDGPEAEHERVGT
jgi:catechol 2,3-dioxygenase-like lactoylglutathione lyase family enzyme